MTWLPSRAAALARLEDFLPRAGRRYAATRNFDLGPDRHSNVSGLSPYLRHRVLTEREVLTGVLGRHTPAAAGEFVEEVFWRWVAGLQTQGKTYLARPENIARYYAAQVTVPEDLAGAAPPLDEAPLPRAVSPVLPESVAVTGRPGLLLTEEDLCPDAMPDAVAVKGLVLPQQLSPLPVSQQVIDFTFGAVSDAVRRATAPQTAAHADAAHTPDAVAEVARWAQELDLQAVVTALPPGESNSGGAGGTGIRSGDQGHPPGAPLQRLRQALLAACLARLLPAQKADTVPARAAGNQPSGCGTGHMSTGGRCA